MKGQIPFHSEADQSGNLTGPQSAPWTRTSQGLSLQVPHVKVIRALTSVASDWSSTQAAVCVEIHVLLQTLLHTITERCPHLCFIVNCISSFPSYLTDLFVSLFLASFILHRLTLPHPSIAHVVVVEVLNLCGARPR
jgi:hypothetical protein